MRKGSSFVGTLGLILVSIPTTIWFGFVLTKLWLWFIVPFGLPMIGVWHASGIRLLVSGFVPNAIDWRDSDISNVERLAREIGYAAFGLALLGIGRGLHLLAG